MRRIATLLVGLTVVSILVGVLRPARDAEAFPTSSNVIPTADMLEAGQVRLEVENDGYTRPFDSDSESFVLTQVGITNWLEVGVDAFDIDVAHDATLPVNAKLSLLSEREWVPALAVGAMDIVKGSSPSVYAAVAKDFGPLRAHLGWLRSDKDDSLIAGADYSVSENLYVLSDWTSGPQGYLTFGIWQRVVDELWLNAAVGRANDLENKALVLLNLSYTFELWPPSRSE